MANCYNNIVEKTQSMQCESGSTRYNNGSLSLATDGNYVSYNSDGGSYASIGIDTMDKKRMNPQSFLCNTSDRSSSTQTGFGWDEFLRQRSTFRVHHNKPTINNGEYKIIDSMQKCDRYSDMPKQVQRKTPWVSLSRAKKSSNIYRDPVGKKFDMYYDTPNVNVDHPRNLPKVDVSYSTPGDYGMLKISGI